MFIFVCLFRCLKWISFIIPHWIFTNTRYNYLLKMCTVTYIPTKKNNFIFTSNRDEAPKRSATGVIEKSIEGKVLLYPKDALANGTWISISNKNQLVCILNGAFIKHKHRPPYRLSRGIMALDFFKYPTANDFFEKFEFDGMEPFTMIIFDDGRLHEFRWDEKEKHIAHLDTSKQYIWSSCTLFTEDWQEKRRIWFDDWKRENQMIDQNAVLDFHRNGGEGHANFDVVMKWKDVVCTTSITSILKEEGQMSMRYEGLLNREIEYGFLKLQTTKNTSD